MMQPKISVIIPTLNEADFIAGIITHTLKMSENPDQLEIIVIDAGSTDQTIKMVPDHVKVHTDVNFKGFRFKSLNKGIELSRADVLIFLDADTYLPRFFDRMVLHELSNHQVLGGAFDMIFTHTDLKLKVLQELNRIRFRLDHNFFGDQAIFCRKSVALDTGGFPPQPILETVYFLRKLKKRGKLVLIPQKVRTSPRRFFTHGFWTVLWYDLRVWCLYATGMKTDKMAHEYWKGDEK